MWRRPETWVGLGFIALLVVLALAGGPGSQDWQDSRRSTTLSGPNGAKGWAEALRRLGVPVVRRERPLFALAADSGALRRGELLAFLDIDELTTREQGQVRNYVANGGRIFVAGYTGIERCFDYRSRRVGRLAAESLAVEAPDLRWDLPPTERVLERIPVESLLARRPERLMREAGCTPLFPAAADTVLAAVDGRPIALTLRFRSGGRALLLADSRYVSNQLLKETDTGMFLVPWLLAERPVRVVVDEYHLGFGRSVSIWSAAARWLSQAPAGWMILQLAAVLLVWLGVQAVRFGPALAVLERRRRSPLEHLEALAAGLEGAVAGGADTAVALTVGGLRRRLSRAGYVPRGDLEPWLATLELVLPTVRGRRAVRRLQETITHPGGAERVLVAAQAVEDVWEDLRPRTTRVAS